MNGINMNTFFSNVGLFQPKKNKGTADKVSSLGKGTEKESKSTNKTPQDTLDISGESRQIKNAGYSKPAMRVRKEEEQLKPLNEKGVQEGVELSDAASSLLDRLKEKYGNMDFYIASTNSDDEAAYYLNQGSKEYSVLIDPETLEAMAEDEEVLAKYEDILNGTDEMFASIKDEIGEENMDKIHSINITFGKDGKNSYIIELFEEMNSVKRPDHGIHKGNDKVDKDKNKDKNKKPATTRIKADTQEELIEKLRAKLAEKTEEKKKTEDKEKENKETE